MIPEEQAREIVEQLQDPKNLKRITLDPQPQLVSLVSWAIRAVTTRLHETEYEPWVKWAATWLEGVYDPQRAVDIGHRCFSHRARNGVFPFSYHALGQIAWAAKEACYNTPTSGWLVVRYIGDAMIAFGVAFPEEGLVLSSARSALAAGKGEQ